MGFISLKAHNVIDYIIGAVLILTPYIFGFADVAAAKTVLLWLGLGLIGYSLITNYRYSIAKIIPLGMHMALDVFVGAVVLLAPWLFGYRTLLSGGQVALHYVLGLGAVALVVFTRPKSETTRTVEERTDIRGAA